MKAPAFLFYVRDWLCSSTVARMSGEQVKAYVYLLCAAWLEDEGATLPTDDATLAAMARVDLETWHRIKPLILTKFQSDGNGRIFNDRQYAEHLKQHHRRTAAAEREHKRSTNRAQNEHESSTNTSTALANANANETAILPRGKRESQREGVVSETTRRGER